MANYSFYWWKMKTYIVFPVFIQISQENICLLAFNIPTTSHSAHPISAHIKEYYLRKALLFGFHVKLLCSHIVIENLHRSENKIQFQWELGA